MNKKILLIVDAQYGFINGNLPVNGAEITMNNLADFIRKNGKEYEKIVLTADWHPHTHCSFKDNGGIWPEHCVQHTHDAAIFQPIVDALNDIKSDYIVLTKGLDEDHEEYSIFKNNESSRKLVNIVNALEIKDIDVCGVALDYCVLDTTKDGIRKLSGVKFHLLKDFAPSIGNVEEVIKEYEKLNIDIA